MLNKSALATFRESVAADVLIMSKSSFSYVAAILNDGVQIYDRYARSAMTRLGRARQDGLADPTLLRSKLETHVAARAQYT